MLFVLGSMGVSVSMQNDFNYRTTQLTSQASPVSPGQPTTLPRSRFVLFVVSLIMPQQRRVVTPHMGKSQEFIASC